MQPDAWGARRSAPGQDGRNHGPAVEVYLAGRYFAVTEDVWPGTPNTLATLNAATLDHLSQLIPPARSAGVKGRKGADNSRSAIAFRMGSVMRRQGKTFKQMCEALRTDPETAEWVREKGDANGGRELRRIWHHAFEKDDDNDARNLPTITVRAGFAP